LIKKTTLSSPTRIFNHTTSVSARGISHSEIKKTLMGYFSETIQDEKEKPEGVSRSIQVQI